MATPVEPSPAAPHTSTGTSPSGTLIVTIAPSACRSLHRVQTEIRAIGLRREDGSLYEIKLARCPIDLDNTSDSVRTFRIRVPPGRFSGLEYDVDKILFGPGDDAGRMSSRPGGRATIEARFQVEDDKPGYVRLRVEVDFLDSGGALDDLVTVLPVEEGGEILVDSSPDVAGFSVGLDATGDPQRVLIHVAPSAFPRGARIHVNPTPDLALPGLFEHQHAVGPVVHITATRANSRPVQLALPYDEERIASARIAPERLVVLQLDEARSCYHELKPIAIDRTARLLLVRADTLSYFFAGTPGIRVDTPDFFTNGFGEVIAFSDASALTVSGQVADPQATVRLPDGATGWSRAGWFAFQGVPLPNRGDNTITLTADVEGLVSHDLVLTIRRPAPPKRVTDPSRIYGSAVAVAPDGVPFVSAVIDQAEFRQSNEGLQPLLETWQRAFQRHGAYVYFHDALAGQWRWIGLLPDVDFENQAALALIEVYNGQFPDRAITVDPQVPEDVRGLVALQRFVEQSPVPEETSALFQSHLQTFYAPPFGAGHFTISPVIPLTIARDGRLAAAFVAATRGGLTIARSSRMREQFRRLYAPRFADPEQRPDVHIGTLLYTTAAPDESAIREIVADEMWCARTQLRINPATGQPVILALAWIPDATEDPRTELALFERDEAGIWSRRTVTGEHQIVDADFQFDAEGTIRMVAAGLGPQEDEYRLYGIRAVEGRFDVSPLLWSEADRSLRDDGLWPRLTIDSQGRSVAAFITPVFGTVVWMVAVEHEGRWNAVRLHLATGSNVEGRVPRVPDQRFARGVVGQSGQSLLAWAPSVSTAPSGRVLCGYGTGFLRLAEIDTPSLSLSQTGVDVDRTLGFFPALALRANGAAVLTYQDMFGSAELGSASRDDLFYFCQENHNEVPSSGSGPLPPTHFIGGPLSLEAFGAHEALNCDRLVSPEEASPSTLIELVGLSAIFPNAFDQFLRSAADRKRPMAMIRSLLRDRQFHVMFNPSGQFRFQFPFQFERSHPGLSAMIDRLPRWPGVLQYTVDNTTFPNEDIERLDVTIVVNPVATLEARFGEDLDRAAGSRSDSRARMPISEELYRLLTVQHGLTLSDRTALQITRVLAAQEQASAPGRNWIIVDPNPFNDVRLHFPTAVQEDGSAFPDVAPLPLTYRLTRREDGGIEVRLDPIVTITDRARFQDRNGYPAPCGVSQHWWDLFASTGFVTELTGALPDVSQLIQNDEVTIHHVLVRGVHLDRYEWLTPAGGQQGAIGFTYAVAQFAAAGVDNAEHAHFHSWTTEPSTIDVVAAPFINAHDRVEWHVRDLGFRQGHVEVDVQDWGDFQWVRDLLPLVPMVGSAFVAIAGRIIGWLAEYEANQRTQRFGELGGELRSRLQQFTDEAFGDQHTEAVFLDRWWLWRWGRLPLPPAPQTRLTAVPAELHFGAAALGAPPTIRPFLLSNDGMLPVMIDEMRVTQGDDAFRVDVAPPWPVVLVRGASQAVALAFAPQGSAGIRTGEVTVRFNGTESLTLPLDGRADPPPVPLLRTVPPDRVHFGSVVVGQTAQASVEMRNEGQGVLDVRAVVIDADPDAQGAFTVTAQTPLVVESSAATQIAVVFAPRATTPAAARARLRIESNDPDRPVAWIELFGAAAASQILVIPNRIAFNPSPLASELPPGMGSTRTIYVYNTGTASLTVQGPSFRAVDPAGSVSPHFLVLDLQGAPVPEETLVMQGGQSLGFTVMFRPTAVGPHEASIQIASSDATRPLIVIPVLGEGIA